MFLLYSFDEKTPVIALQNFDTFCWKEQNII